MHVATMVRRYIPYFLVLLYLVSVTLFSSVAGFSVQRYRHPFVNQHILFARADAQSGVSHNERKSTLQKLGKGDAPNKRTALKWVIQSIERCAQDPKYTIDKPSPQLLDALYKLQRGKSSV
jgi:hypothetical protein